MQRATLRWNTPPLLEGLDGVNKMSKSLGNGIEPQDIISQYGADVLRLVRAGPGDFPDAPVLSIGGAGTFDGVFLTGVIAVLLA